jgi:mono/diheme cytochrome c family protein
MKRNLTIILTSILLLSGVRGAFAADGTALFKSKCAGCHGAEGQGKPAMKAPSLKDSKFTDEQIVAHLLKGEPTSKAPHNKGLAGLKPDQAAAIAAHVKSLK